MKGLAYRFFLPVMIAALLGLVLPVSLVLADETITLDFTTSDHGCSVIPLVGGYNYGSYVPGTGFAASYADDTHTRWRVNCPSLIYENVYNITFQWNSPELGNIVTLRAVNNSIVVSCWETSSCAGQYLTFVNSTSVGGGSYQHSFDFLGGDVDLLSLDMYEDWGSHFDAVLQSIIIYTHNECTEDCGGGLGDLTMPLKSDDLHPQWAMYDPAYAHEIDPTWPDNDGIQPVLSFSDKVDADVHAVAAGEVIDVNYNIHDQCDYVPLTQSCYVVIPQGITQESSAILWLLEMPNSAIVDVRSDDDPSITFAYFVSSPSVSVGDHLDPGCILGKTIQLKQPPFNISGINLGASVGGDGVTGSIGVDVGFQSQLTTNSVTVVRMDQGEDAPRLYPLLTQEPDPSSCGNGNFGGCVNSNSSITSFQDWFHSDGVTLLDGGGVLLPTSSQIYQTGLEVDEATTYTLNVQARSSQAGNGFDVVPRIRLFAGTEIAERPITTTWVNYSFDFLGEDLQPEQAFGVVNQTLTGTDIEIRYICLSEENTGQVTSGCYFKNHHFDDGPTNWTITEGVTFQAGQAYTYNDSVVEQGAILNPISGEEAADYTLKVVGRLIATNAYTGQIDKSVTIQYRYPTGGTYTDVGTIDSALVDSEGKRLLDGSVNLEHAYTLTTTVSVSAFTTGLFSFKTLVDDSDNYLLGFRIDYLCLQSPVSDGSFPGQGGGGFDPPFYENCEVIATPEDNNISSWTYYHWSNLKRFFDCTLMVKLNSMAQLMDSAWKTTRLFFRWVVATGQLSGRWVSTQVFPWLNGQFRNIAFGQVTTVYQEGGGSCNDFFCVLNSLITGILTPINNIVNTLLSFLTVAVDLLLTVITGIIGLALSFLVRLLGLFNQATGLLGGILNAYNNATPTAVDGLPMCNIDPDSSLFCRGTWLLDNTILAGRWGILITLIIGVAGVHLILWVIGEFKTAIVTTGSGS